MAQLITMIISEKLSSVAFNEISLPSGVKEDLIKLRNLMAHTLRPSIGWSNQARHEKEYDVLVERRSQWMEVKDALNDAVDVIEEVEFEALRRRIVEKQYDSFGRKVSRFFSSDNHFAFGFTIARKLKVILERFDKIFFESRWRDPDDFLFYYFVFVDQLDGIDERIEEARIIEMLLRQDDPNSFTVIPIVGLQRTKIAKSVYEDERVFAGFDLMRWVDVSSDFDVVRYIHSSFYGEDGTNSLHGQKVLLVLDDVCNIHINEWLKLREFLARSCAKGSRVIVTTDIISVYSIVSRRADRLRDPPEKDSLSLFFKYLSRYHQELKNIAKEITMRRISSTFVEFGETTGFQYIFQLSRHRMSLCLKQCFAFCSTFPMFARMTSLDLIAKWMALGFLQLSAEEDMELEDIGQLQFKELCDMGVFQCHDDITSFTHDITSFTHSYICDMHPFLHRLARSFSTADCYIINTGEESIPSFVRHLRIFLNGNHLPDFTKFKKLRSIQIHTELGFDIDDFILSAAITKLRYLRIFDLHDSSFKVLPNSIGTLKQLRYLNLSKNRKIEKLPDSICKLLFLQTLLLEGCHSLEELPRDMSLLVSLRTLSVTTKQMYFPENGIGSIISLRTLIISRV